MNERIQALRHKMAGLDLQGMIISNPINVKYLTGIDAEGILLLTRKENIYVTDARYTEYVTSILTPFDEIVVDDQKNISKYDYENYFLFCENVGFEEDYVTYATYKEYMHKYKINNFVEAARLIEALRVIKDDEEVKNVKTACEITDKCFNFLLDYIKPGMTEKEIARKIHDFYMDNAEGESFEAIVASGENSSKPHAIPTDRKIHVRDIILIDMGCKVNGYCSDMTRTIFVGEPLKEQLEVYNLVLETQKKVLNEIKDGQNIKALSKIAENNFANKGYTLVHSLGHGVGLEIHENPRVNIKNDSNLKENMIITDEPGIYLTGNFGIRIEDTVLVTKLGAIALTESNKECIII